MYSKQDSQTIDVAKASEYNMKFRQDLDEIKQSESLLDERLRPNYAMAGFL